MINGLTTSVPALSGGQLRQAVRDVLAKFLDLDRYEVFIFGSEVGRSESSRSDIDIGIRGPDPVPGATMERIREELETLRTLRTFDVVDFTRVDESFKTVALQHVETL